MKILLYDNGTTLGKMFDIVEVDDALGTKLMSERRAFNAASPSIRRRFSAMIQKRAEEKALSQSVA